MTRASLPSLSTYDGFNDAVQHPRINIALDLIKHRFDKLNKLVKCSDSLVEMPRRHGIENHRMRVDAAHSALRGTSLPVRLFVLGLRYADNSSDRRRFVTYQKISPTPTGLR